MARSCAGGRRRAGLCRAARHGGGCDAAAGRRGGAAHCGRRRPAHGLRPGRRGCVAGHRGLPLGGRAPELSRGARCGRRRRNRPHPERRHLRARGGRLRPRRSRAGVHGAGGARPAGARAGGARQRNRRAGRVRPRRLEPRHPGAGRPRRRPPLPRSPRPSGGRAGGHPCGSARGRRVGVVRRAGVRRARTADRLAGGRLRQLAGAVRRTRRPAPPGAAVGRPHRGRPGPGARAALYRGGQLRGCRRRADARAGRGGRRRPRRDGGRPAALRPLPHAVAAVPRRSRHRRRAAARVGPGARTGAGAVVPRRLAARRRPLQAAGAARIGRGQPRDVDERSERRGTDRHLRLPGRRAPRAPPFRALS